MKLRLLHVIVAWVYYWATYALFAVFAATFHRTLLRWMFVGWIYVGFALGLATLFAFAYLITHTLQRTARGFKTDRELLHDYMKSQAKH